MHGKTVGRLLPILLRSGQPNHHSIKADLPHTI